MKRLTKTIMMLSPFSFAGLIWEPPLAEGMREIREGNFDRAVEVFEDAAGGELNQQEAVYGKALCYWFGIGVEKDQKIAVKMLEKDKMSPLKMEYGPEKQAAQYMLGVYYMKQKESDLRENGEAYMRAAATAGHAASQFQLGSYYYHKFATERGNINTIRFQQDAQSLLTKAVNNPKLSADLKEKAEAYLAKLPKLNISTSDDPPQLAVSDVSEKVMNDEVNSIFNTETETYDSLLSRAIGKRILQNYRRRVYQRAMLLPNWWFQILEKRR